VSKVVRVALGFNLGDGTPALTRFFVRYSGTAPTNADLATFDAAIATAYGTNLKSLADTGQIMNEVSSQDLSTATAGVDDSTVSVAGTRGASFIGASSALVASYRIARRYRGGHPRGYWPFGIQTDLNDRNTWKSTFITAANTGLTAFFTAVNAAGWSGAGTLDHVNVSFYSGFTVVTNPITGRARNVPTLRGTPLIDAVTATFAQSSVGSQRRRDAFHS
jgi:hypothetical protein